MPFITLLGGFSSHLKENLKKGQGSKNKKEANEQNGKQQLQKPKLSSWEVPGSLVTIYSKHI